VTYAYFAEVKWWRRVMLVAAVVPVAIIANAGRVAGTGVMAHYWGVEAAEGFMHGFSGWLVFVLALMMIFALARVLSLGEKLFGRARPMAEPGRRDEAPDEQGAAD
jgi:exosortase/archaeosortase family protein